jgi:3-phenylpropionate/trans-cinnamate dioxygenase ferredoxin component
VTDMKRAAALSDIPEGGTLAVEIDGVEVALVRTSHAQIALSEGEVEGCEIECWLHGSMFDLRTGKPTNLPATEPVPIYPCRVDGDEVYVDVHNPLNND